MADTDRPWMHFVRETFPLARREGGGANHGELLKPPQCPPIKPPTRDAVAVQVEWTDDGCHVTWQIGDPWKDDDG